MARMTSAATMRPDSSLSKRGRDLTSDRLGPNAREATEKIGFYNGPWDPETNPDGLVNLGTAENV
ncbi:hypothetical protein SLS60_008133 [Paraconiothyrium brasiliense]|uniref:Uncharacterized protein n=1 Tax=Paraconiothyrium brasiliense TaxID=300254 RepID=A0ABR3R3N8_9PLEO